MTLRLQLDPKLGVGVDDRLRRVLVDAARVTREIQSPPILKVALESADVAIAATTPTVIPFDTVYFNTHGWWDATAYRYTPKKAGYYLCSWLVKYVPPGGAAWATVATMQKDGATKAETYNLSANGGQTYSSLAGSTIIYCNGVAEYLDLSTETQLAADLSSALGRTQLSINYIGDDALR